MFAFLTQRFYDMARLKKLFLEAERLANADGQAEPGAEHMVIAALMLPEDDSGRRAFARLGATPTAFQQAVEHQYVDALRSIGIDAPIPPDRQLIAAPVNEKKGFFRSQPSMHDLLDAVTTNKEFAPGEPFRTAEVVLGATKPEYGVVARALKSMGLDRNKLAEAARAELKWQR